MAVRKKKVAAVALPTQDDQLKEEVIQLLTGQDPNNEGEFDYVAMIKRVTLLLIVVYGISRFSILRQLALSIVTTLGTRWLAQTATEALASS